MANPVFRFIANHALSLLPAAALFFWPAVFDHGQAGESRPSDRFIGWLILLLLLTTWGVVVQAAVLFSASRHKKIYGRLLGGGVTLTLAICAALAGPGLIAGFLSAPVAARLCCLVLAWAVFCTGLTLLLCRCVSPGGAVAIALLIAGALIFMPITAVPVLGFASEGGHSWPLMGLVNSCPTLWLLHAVPPNLHTDAFAWFHLRVMYHLTTLGQNVIMPPQLSWQTDAFWATVLGVLLIVAARLRLHPDESQCSPQKTRKPTQS